MLKKILCSAGIFITSCQDPSTSLREIECSPKDLMSQLDLAPTPTKCAAAKGLSGDVLLCVAFTDSALLDILTN